MTIIVAMAAAAAAPGNQVSQFPVVLLEGLVKKNVVVTAVAALLTAIAGVQSHRVDAGVHQLSVRELHTAVPLLFASLAAQGKHLSEFRTHSATLEDVFVGLTGRNLRDE